MALHASTLLDCLSPPTVRLAHLMNYVEQPFRLDNALSAHNHDREVTALKRRSAQTKTTPEGAAYDYLLYNYYFFRLATPIKPIRPEPNNQTAAGTGTELTLSTSRLLPLPISKFTFIPANGPSTIGEPPM